MVSEQLRDRYDRVREVAALRVEWGVAPDIDSALRMTLRRRRDPDASRREYRTRLQQKYYRNAHVARQIPASLRRAVLASGPCIYCGDPKPTHVDHIVPVCLGGTRRRSNLAPACLWCNQEKGQMTVAEWILATIDAGRTWPPYPVVVRSRAVSDDGGR